MSRLAAGERREREVKDLPRLNFAWRPSRAAVEAAVVLAGCLVVYAVAQQLNAFDQIVALAKRHEAWEIDEAFLALLVAGLAGFVYATRRATDLRAEIRRRRIAEGEAQRLAVDDALTGLPNRHSCELRLERTIREAKEKGIGFAVMLLDLDNFKAVNNVRGHGVGDRLLGIVAGRLAANLRQGDFVARLGGDEFGIIANSAGDGDAAARMAVRIVRTIAEPMAIENTVVEIGASLGAARFPEDGDDIKTLMRRADVALYRAKTEGRGLTRFFEVSMDTLVSQRATIETALRIAIRKGEIDVHYQPLINLHEDRIIGFEALARWTDAELGVVPPSIFIPIAEDAGLIAQLSGGLLRRACRDAVMWPEDMTLAVNISPTQLTDRGLGASILAALEETGLSARRLEVEITESAIVREPEAAQAILAELHNAGIKLALDDFGTGYSSLAQLSRFPFDKLKIDRSFIDKATDDEQQATLVKAIIGLARGLGMATTAEGIENSRQLTFLKKENCDYGQGYLIGRPATAEATLLRAFRNLPEADRLRLVS